MIRAMILQVGVQVLLPSDFRYRPPQKTTSVILDLLIYWGLIWEYLCNEYFMEGMGH